MTRKSFVINDNWIFEGPGGQETKVNLPHTWNNVDGQDGGNDYIRDRFTYRKTLECPDFDPEKEEVYLEFQGVNSVATVFLNGEKMGMHEGGYSTFRYKISDYLKPGENSLQVDADNSRSDRVYPQMADFTFYGGIYRDVKVLIVNKYHFDLENYGTTGIRVTPFYEGDSKRLHIKSYIDELPNKEGIKLHYIAYDAEKRSVAEKWANGGDSEAVLNIANPHLWNGVHDPYLYSLKTELFKDENLCDEVTLSFGIRSFRVDPKQGFFLNGKSYPLHGVSRHQDFKGLGNAITRAHHDRDMELIRELGANTIRLAHYQHDQYFYDLCDRYGMIVWAEIPYISDHLKNGNENTESQMRELIAQNYHHASIVTWGISNEITITRSDRQHMLENHRAMNELVHSLDPTRVTTLACYAMCNPFSKVVHITDIVGYNLYLGWYVPGLWLNRAFISLFHLVYPKRPLGYSEYGAEGMPNLHSEHPQRGDHTEEYQAKYHEYMLRIFRKYPFMWGNYVWNMFDFAADARDQGGEPGMNHKGLVTFDRETKKDSFYLYKCFWNDEPMLHIAGKRFVERKKKTVEIKIYSNCEKVALYRGDVLVEEKAGDKVFKFKTKLADGENTFLAKAFTKDGRELTDSIRLIRSDNARSYKLVKNTAKSDNWM